MLPTQGADIEGRDASDRTPRKVATERAKVEVVKVLLEKGANVEAKSKSTPLNCQEDFVPAWMRQFGTEEALERQSGRKSDLHPH